MDPAPPRQGGEKARKRGRETPNLLVHDCVVESSRASRGRGRRRAVETGSHRRRNAWFPGPRILTSASPSPSATGNVLPRARSVGAESFRAVGTLLVPSQSRADVNPFSIDLDSGGRGAGTNTVFPAHFPVGGKRERLAHAPSRRSGRAPPRERREVRWVGERTRPVQSHPRRRAQASRVRGPGVPRVTPALCPSRRTRARRWLRCVAAVVGEGRGGRSGAARTRPRPPRVFQGLPVATGPDGFWTGQGGGDVGERRRE